MPFPSPPAPRRTRTPSDLKWLLNERSELLGRFTKQQELTLKLQADVTKAEQVAQSQRELLAQHIARRQDTERCIRVLVHTLALAYPVVDPAGFGPINAWVGQFGQRGALIRFLRQTIEATAPDGCTTKDLVKAARDAFALHIDTWAKWEALRYTVRGRLRELRDRDGAIVSEQSGPARTSEAVWRIKPPSTLDDLRALALAAEQAEAATDERPTLCQPAVGVTACPAPTPGAHSAPDPDAL